MFLVVDELIRQITLDSPDRGLMFLRIRDEIRMTMAAYETLFERGVAYGTRNALTFEQQKEGTSEKVLWRTSARFFALLKVYSG